MSGFFNAGETKIRPGVYHRYDNIGNADVVTAREGVGVAVVSGNWGALNTPVHIDGSINVPSIIGYGSGNEVVTEMLAGGVSELIVVRVGHGGKNATVKLKDSATSGADVIELTTLYPTSRQFTVTVKASLTDETQKELSINEGSKVLEKFGFAIGGSEVDSLIAVLADSKYVAAKKLSAGNGTIANVQQSAFAGGADPDIDTEAYSDAFSAAESETMDMICVDSNDQKVHNLLSAFINRIFQDGSYPMGCVSEPKSVKLETRISHARSMNDEKIIYVLNSWTDSANEVYEGYKAAARIGGMICASSSGASLTHDPIKRAVALNETLTNSEIKKALQSGCFAITTSKAGDVRIEQSINTLVNPSGNQDEGWKKVRRTKTRFEMMDRIDRVLDPMIGAVNNDSDGRAAVVAAAQRVIDTMIGEKKLLAGTFAEDPDYPARGDSAWFIITVDDIDSIEHMYLAYHFRFSPEN